MRGTGCYVLVSSQPDKAGSDDPTFWPTRGLSLSLSEVWFLRRQHEIHSIIYDSMYERRSISWLAKFLSAE